MTLQSFLDRFEVKCPKPYKLTTPLDNDSRVFDPNNRPPGTVVSEGFEAAGMGEIELPFPVVSIKGREDLLKTFGNNLKRIDPRTLNKEKYPVGMVSTVFVPYLSGYRMSANKMVLMPVPALADKILWSIENIKEDEENAGWEIQRTVWNFYREIISTLSSRSGLIRGEIYETRMRNSLRAVCLPDTQLKMNEAAVGTEHFNYLTRHVNKIEYPTVYCLLDREPNLWTGSVQVLKLVQKTENSDVIYINPLSHLPLGADFDGDCVSIVIPPHNPLTYKELQTVCGSAIVDHGKWSEEFLLGSKKEKPDFSKYDEDLKTRTETSYTLSPEDILTAEGSYFDKCRETGAKRIPDDFINYAAGQNIENFCDVAEETALQLTRMKREIGLIGALTDKINQLLLAVQPEKLKIGFRLKETITQLLLDSKSGTDAFDSHELFNLFNLKGKYFDISKKQFRETLKQLGFTREMLNWTREIMEDLWDLLPLNKAVSSILPQYHIARTNEVNSLVRAMVEPTEHICIVDKVMEYATSKD